MTVGAQLARPRALTKAKREALILRVAAAVAAWAIDSEECHLCGRHPDDCPDHWDDCPLFGVSDDDVRAIAEGGE